MSAVLVDDVWGERMADELRQDAATARPDRSDSSWLTSNPDRVSVINWAALQDREPPQRFWHLPEWLSDHPTLFAGAGGKGKTSIAQAVATSLAMGLGYIAAAPKPVNVLMWGCEDDHDEFWRRQAAINAHFGIGMSDIIGRFTLDVRRGYDNTLFTTAYGSPVFTPLLKELREQVGDYRASVVILDNLGQVFGGNENDRHHVTMFVNGVYGIGATIVPRFTPIMLGHISRSQGSEFSGNLAWENSCRMRWYLGETLPDQKPDKDEVADPETVYLCKRKANYTPKDFTKLTFRNGLFIPAGLAGEFNPSDEAAEQALMQAYDVVIQAGVQPTDGRTSQDYLPAVVKRMGLCPSFSMKQLAAAMSRLMGQGKLRRTEVGQYSNRSPKFRLVKV